MQKFFSYFYARVFHLPRRDAWHLAVDGKGRLRSKNLNSARNPDFPPRFRHAVFARRRNPRFCLYASGGEFQADRDNQTSHIFSGKKESEARKKARGSKRKCAAISGICETAAAAGGRIARTAGVFVRERRYAGFPVFPAASKRLRLMGNSAGVAGNAPPLRKLAEFPVMRWKRVWSEPTCRKFLKSGGRTIRKIRFITATKNGRERAIARFNCLIKFSLRKLDIFKNRFHKY